MQHSLDVSREHVPGKWCKEHNQCYTCCELKHLFRILKHYAEKCSPKKCPVCEWARNPEQEFNVGFYAKDHVRYKHVIQRIYKLMLGNSKWK